MDFAFTEEQQLLQDSTRHFLTERYGLVERRRIRNSTDGWSREVWRGLGDLGVLALNIPERDGGIGAGPVENMLVAMAMGEALLLEPFWSSAVVATVAIVRLGSEVQRKRWLPSLAAGELVAVLVRGRVLAGAPAADPGAQARWAVDHWQLTGRESLVYHAPAASLLLVPARTEDGVLGLFAVPADAPGLRLYPQRTVDEQCAAAVMLDRVSVGKDARLGGDASAVLQDVGDVGLAALCGDAFGAMDRAFSATVEYSRLRTQFGVPIARFQALQHRMADMLMHLEQARSMAYLAASVCTDTDPVRRGTALDAAKVLMGQAARFIGQHAIQLHGGMGMTDELAIGEYFKRLLAFELRGGTTDQRLEHYRTMTCGTPA